VTRKNKVEESQEVLSGSRRSSFRGCSWKLAAEREKHPVAGNPRLADWPTHDYPAEIKRWSACVNAYLTYSFETYDIHFRLGAPAFILIH
jgi:hypothetical protein